jgi:hypothetical protein
MGILKSFKKKFTFPQLIALPIECLDLEPVTFFTNDRLRIESSLTDAETLKSPGATPGSRSLRHLCLSHFALKPDYGLLTLCHIGITLLLLLRTFSIPSPALKSFAFHWRSGTAPDRGWGHILSQVQGSREFLRAGPFEELI